MQGRQRDQLCRKSVVRRGAARAGSDSLRTQRLDSDQSGGLDSYEFCAAINKLVREPQSHPRSRSLASTAAQVAEVVCPSERVIYLSL